MLSKTLQNQQDTKGSKLKNNLAGILAGSALAMSSVSADAQQMGWFNVNANVDVSPSVVRATVSNNSPYTWYCRGNAFGRTQYGQWVENNFHFSVPPGQYRYGYVNSGMNSYFVQGDANVRCRSN